MEVRVDVRVEVMAVIIIMVMAITIIKATTSHVPGVMEMVAKGKVATIIFIN